MKKGKKIALFVSMVLVLTVAVILNVTLLAANGSNNNGDGDALAAGSFFATNRENRMATRNYEIQQLKDIIALEGEEFAEARANAAAQVLAVNEAMELELLLETVLKSLGFSDVFASVSTFSDFITIIVEKEELEHQDTVRIYNEISLHTDIEPKYVSIIAL